jgi:hypothetical protein
MPCEARVPFRKPPAPSPIRNALFVFHYRVASLRHYFVFHLPRTLWTNWRNPNRIYLFRENHR